MVYDTLCDTCAATYAPELYKSLKSSYLIDPANKAESGLNFAIEFTRDNLNYNEQSCALCKGPVSPLRPFSIIGIDDAFYRKPVCSKCSKAQFPNLIQILKHFYVSGLDMEFLRRYEREKASLKYGIFRYHSSFGKLRM